MISERMNYLVERFFNQSISDHEKVELAKWIEQAKNDEQLKEVLEHAWQQHTATVAMPDEMSERIESFIFRKEPGALETVSMDNRRLANRRISWLQVAAAIAFIIVSAVVYMNYGKTPEPAIAEKETEPIKETDIAPGGNKAILTLANGRQIVLDSVSNGLLATQGNAELRKVANGQIAYHATGGSTGEIMYNTMNTPVGGQYHLLLPDGTGVWLNAASSIRFPAAFSGEERKVIVTGEAYFEVAPLIGNTTKKKVPFIVQITSPSGEDKGEVQVLGTHFNVNAYAEEELVKTTLLEGKVNMVKDGVKVSLSPGQQAQLSVKGIFKVKTDADVEEAIAWKNGYFQFNSADLPTVLRQAARWYDLEVELPANIPADRFSGKISRSVNLSRLLKWMQWSDVHFKVEGKKIIVLP